MPPWRLSIAILLPEAPGVWAPLVKQTPDWLWTLPIGTVSTTLTAMPSDSLYNISISSIFKAFDKV